MPTHNTLPSESEYFKGKLFTKFIEDLRLAGLANRTVYGYARSVKKLAQYARCSPDKITQQQVRKFFLNESHKKQMANGTQSVLLSSIKFFYRVTLPRVKPSGKQQCETRQLSGEAFVGSFAQHILPSKLQKIRYYGFMSPNSRLQLEDVRWLVWLWKGWTYWLGSAMFQPVIKKPIPTCSQCGGELELLFITNEQQRVIWKRSAPKRGPP